MKVKVKVEKETLKDSLKFGSVMWVSCTVLLILMKLNGEIDYSWVKTLGFLWAGPIATVMSYYFYSSAVWFGGWLKRK